MTDLKRFVSNADIQPVENTFVHMHIETFRELEQYRAIGTVEEIQSIKDQLLMVKDMCKDYYEIGTIDELQALKEKNEPKKPLFSTIHGDSAYHCSSCKKFVGFYDTRIYEYCHNCGQKLDWQ